MKRQLILVYPPHFEDKTGMHGQDRDWFPLGIASIAGYIGRKIDIDIICLDLFDLSYDEAKDKIFSHLEEDCINYVGFTLMTEQRHVVFDLIDDLKAFYVPYNVVTIVGGPHASIMYDQILDTYDNIDHVVIGEGEKGIEYILSGENKAIRRLVNEGELDIIPSAFDGLKYFEFVKLGTQAPIVFSRGCTSRCTFCSTMKTWKKYRVREAQDVYNEVLNYIKEYSIIDFKFHDDSATTDLNKIAELCNKIINGNYNITFEMTARADQLDENTIILLKRAGLKKIALGIESGNDKLRKAMNKQLDIEKAKENIKLLKLYNIHVHLLFIIGYPGETEETIEETRQFIIEVKPNSFSNLPGLMVIPGTPVYNRLKKEKWIDDAFWLKRHPAPYYTGEHDLNTLNAFSNIIRLGRNQKIVIMSVVHQKPEIFKEYLNALNALEIPPYLTISKYFVLHNCDKLAEYLQPEEYETIHNNLTHDLSHTWTYEKFNFITQQKNKLVEIAKNAGADYIFWVDSDLILQPPTLKVLFNVGVPVISEIFWTRWPGADERELPNCWDADHYSFSIQPEEFRKPGTYKVGGTGACILVNMPVYKYANYTPIYNVSFSAWEDRAFCIRAAVANIPIYVNTQLPAMHLYTEEIFNKWYNENKGGGPNDK